MPGGSTYSCRRFPPNRFRLDRAPEEASPRELQAGWIEPGICLTKGESSFEHRLETGPHWTQPACLPPGEIVQDPNAGRDRATLCSLRAFPGVVRDRAQ